MPPGHAHSRLVLNRIPLRSKRKLLTTARALFVTDVGTAAKNRSRRITGFFHRIKRSVAASIWIDKSLGPGRIRTAFSRDLSSDNLDQCLSELVEFSESLFSNRDWMSISFEITLPDLRGELTILTSYPQ